MSSEDMHHAVTITGLRLLRLPQQRLAILLVGHRRANERYSEAFEVTHEALNLLRTEVIKAERCLSMPAGTVLADSDGLGLPVPGDPTANPVSVLN